MDNRPHPYGPDELWEKNLFFHRIEGLDINDEAALVFLIKELAAKRSFSYAHNLFTQLTSAIKLARSDPGVYKLESLDILIDKERIAAEWDDVVIFHEAAELVFLIKSLQEKLLPLLEDTVLQNKALLDSAHEKALLYEYRKIGVAENIDEYQAWLREFYQLMMDEEKDLEKNKALEQSLASREKVYEAIKKEFVKRE